MSEPSGVVIAIDRTVKQFPDGAARSEVEGLGDEAIEGRGTQVGWGLTIEQAVV